MTDKRIIVINGFARGGTNILWNILISHPQIASSLGETQQVIRPKKIYHLLVWLLNNGFITNEFLKREISKTIFNKINQARLNNLNNQYDKYKNKNEIYTEEEITNTIVCIKGNNDDINLNDIFRHTYSDVNYFGLMRNGYALCNGYLRRGWDIDTIGDVYLKFGKKLIEDSKNYESYKLIKFEDMIKNPFNTAEELYKYLNLNQNSVEDLKLMVKKTMNENGDRTENMGSYGEKYWFSKNNIHELINPNINILQANKLKDNDRINFERKAKYVLEYFGYMEE